MIATFDESREWLGTHGGAEGAEVYAGGGVFSAGPESPGRSVFGDTVSDEVIAAHLSAAEGLMERTLRFDAAKVSREWVDLWTSVRAASGDMSSIVAEDVAVALIARLGSQTARQMLKEWTPSIMARQVPSTAPSGKTVRRSVSIGITVERDFEHDLIHQVWTIMCERLDVRVLPCPEVDLSVAVAKAEDEIPGDRFTGAEADLPLGSFSHDTLGYASPAAHVQEIEEIEAADDEWAVPFFESRQRFMDEELAEIDRERSGSKYRPAGSIGLGGHVGLGRQTAGCGTVDDLLEPSPAAPTLRTRLGSYAGNMKHAGRRFLSDATYLTIGLARDLADRVFGGQDVDG